MYFSIDESDTKVYEKEVSMIYTKRYKFTRNVNMRAMRTFWKNSEKNRIKYIFIGQKWNINTDIVPQNSQSSI